MQPTMKSRIAISIIFLVLFGILGYHYFNDTISWVDNSTKNILGIEQTRDLMPTNLPVWASTAFGSIIGWLFKELIMWIYIKFIKHRFIKKKVGI